jgi:hypothetical protein
MKRFAPALVALTLLAGPALAGGVVMDFPHLTWPDDSATTRACGTHSTPTPAATCSVGN